MAEATCLTCCQRLLVASTLLVAHLVASTFLLREERVKGATSTKGGKKWEPKLAKKEKREIDKTKKWRKNYIYERILDAGKKRMN